jgi:type IX secretion system PorP/SprF family membrane protein
MIKQIFKYLLPVIIITFPAAGQDALYSPGYQWIMINNPAVTGSEGDGILRLSYLNIYPGNNYNLHSAFLSYDGYFPSLHGGAGFYLSDNYLGGIVNDIRGGFSYAYFLQAGRNLYINAGLSASLYHRGYNIGNVVLPDQIDPLGGVVFPPGESLDASGKTIFDIGTGFLFISGRIFGGFSVIHLSEPDLSDADSGNEKLKRKLLFHISGDFDLRKEKYLKIRPVGIFELQKGYLSSGTGAALETSYLSINTLVFADNSRNIDIQTGFSLSAGRISLFYNYRFNIKSGNRMMPLSLLHHTGIAMSLHNVDKRNIVKTINYPKL